MVAATARLRPRPEIALTTNGVGLARRAAGLAAAGLDRVNVSLDTVDAAHFAAITRRRRLDEVLEGLAAAASAGLSPVKVNAVRTRSPVSATSSNCCASACSMAISCGSSNRCRWMPTIGGA